jgi:hypothetical protein
MIGNRQGKTEISVDLVEWLSPRDLRDAVQNCPRSYALPTRSKICGQTGTGTFCDLGAVQSFHFRSCHVRTGVTRPSLPARFAPFAAKQWNHDDPELMLVNYGKNDSLCARPLHPDTWPPDGGANAHVAI